MSRSMRSRSVVALTLARGSLVVLALWAAGSPGSARADVVFVSQEVRDEIANTGRARVIVQVQWPGAFIAEGALPTWAQVLAQRSSIAFAQSRVLSRLQGYGHSVLHRFDTVPYVVLLNTGVQIFEGASGGATYQNNLVNEFSDGMYFNNTSQAVHTIGTLNATVAGGGNVSGNPAFVNAAGNDFRLTGGSAAIDQGTAAGAPPDDWANLNRPVGAGVDIGAYEFTSQSVAKSPLYRFFSRTNSVHFYTQSKAERDQVLASYPYRVWRFEGIAYQTYPSPVAQTVVVHRFFSFTFGSHFSTTNLCEMYTDCQVHAPGAPQAVYPDNVWHYEGIAFDVYPTAIAGAVPVYRFHSPVTAHHFYTSNEAEKNGLIANPGPDQWQLEGIAWYVPQS
jgi:hypothetical protein